MKTIKVELNSVTNEYQRVGIILVANKMINEYMNSLQMFPGLGPEAFAESWIKNSIVGSKVFKDDITKVFISMLMSMKKNG